VGRVLRIGRLLYTIVGGQVKYESRR